MSQSSAETLRREMEEVRCAGLRPPPRIALPEWADTFRRLSASTSAIAGKWRTESVEVARGPMMAVNREHSLNPKPSWFGESVGHYDNGELIIDTIGFIEHPYSFVDNWRTPHTKDLHTVERWRLVDGGTTIEANVTIDDSGAFNAPWSGRARWKKFNGPLMESTCAENNENYGRFLGLREYPMPEAKMLDF